MFSLLHLQGLPGSTENKHPTQQHKQQQKNNNNKNITYNAHVY